MITSRSFILRKKNVSDKSRRENRNTQFTFIFFFGNCAVYEIIWEKKIVQSYRPQMTIWRMRIACWITKATNIHSE